MPNCVTVKQALTSVKVGNKMSFERQLLLDNGTLTCIITSPVHPPRRLLAR